MEKDPWLPVGFILPDGSDMQGVIFGGPDWQIINLKGEGRCLLVKEELLQRWLNSSLVPSGVFEVFNFGSRRIGVAASKQNEVLCPVAEASVIRSKSAALSFALALKETRRIGVDDGLQDAIYFEKISRLLPTYSISAKVSDEVVLGYWMTGGVNLSATAVRRLDQCMAWLNSSQIRDVVQAAGFRPAEIMPNEADKSNVDQREHKKEIATSPSTRQELDSRKEFDLPGRPELATFFNEHIIDIIRHQDRYRALGIDFPSAVILHGPPGCGKTFAIEKLIEFLGWPSFQIDASSVASPYIHETSKKVAEIFQQAIDNSPSVLVIDEMEAFLADRNMESGHHRVEEVAEFLRRIPEAVSKGVLLIAMTNRIDMIDPAIQRRGRFDHIIKVDFASEKEISALLVKLLEALPTSSNVDVGPLALGLSGRPLSDVSFVVREAGRLSAKAGDKEIDQDKLLSALKLVPAREQEGNERRRKIGFS
ncbi:MAG: ATP-binding protein [Hyphomicrobiales bacterium]|nr:ATP-binding protein [Hyphomicrobiales bacterium]